MTRDIIQQQFLELVRTGLFPDHNARVLPHGNCVDWDIVYRLAEEQSVMGLVAAGIENLPASERPPKEVVLQFIGSTFQLEQRNKAMNAFVAKLIEQLRAEDIYAILVKGQGMAQCYEKPLWRACGDVDLLLSESNYERAKELLCPLATDVETEYTHFKHQGMTIDGWVVELHGTLYSRLSKRVDRLIDELQKDVFYGGNVRSWDNSGTQVFLPSPDNDVIFVFTHILHHFFFEGIGLRQICDWCRLLWTYRESLNHGLLESLIRKAGLMSEWKAFGAFAVEVLGMPEEAMPLYSPALRWKRKANRILEFILMSGNMGHNREKSYGEYPYLIKKVCSMGRRISDVVNHARIFPLDSIRFLTSIMFHGIRDAVRGE